MAKGVKEKSRVRMTNVLCSVTSFSTSHRYCRVRQMATRVGSVTAYGRGYRVQKNKHYHDIMLYADCLVFYSGFVNNSSNKITALRLIFLLGVANGTLVRHRFRLESVQAYKALKPNHRRQLLFLHKTSQLFRLNATCHWSCGIGNYLVKSAIFSSAWCTVCKQMQICQSLLITDTKLMIKISHFTQL